MRTVFKIYAIPIGLMLIFVIVRLLQAVGPHAIDATNRWPDAVHAPPTCTCVCPPHSPNP